VNDLSAVPDIDFASPVYVDDLGGPMFVTPYVLVSFNDAVPPAEREALFRKAGSGSPKAFEALGIFRLRSDARTGQAVLDAANALALEPAVRFAEPDMVFTGRGDLIPNDTGFGNCWGLQNTGQNGGTAGIDMKAVQAWDITTGSTSIITVIIDTGSDQSHPDLHQVPGNDFTSDASTTGDPVTQYDSHGTAVAGCVSATINNALGTVGIAPNTYTAAARTFITINSGGAWNSNASWTVDAINWAVDLVCPANTNNSNYYGFTSAAVETAYSSTYASGMVHFGSAGNDAANAISYPASLPTVNAVSAVDRNGNPSSFSNYNAGISVSAPGTAIYTTDRTGSPGYASGDYATVDGTSFASPYAAGVAALLLSRSPWYSASQVEGILRYTATDLGPAGFDPEFGHGMVNAYAAIRRPVNDDVCNALPLAPGTQGSFSTFNATLQAGEPSPPVGACTGLTHWCSPASNSVWFTFVGPSSGRVSLNFGSTVNWDSQLAVWSAASCSDLLSGGGTLIAANDDVAGSPNYSAVIDQLCVTPGETYYLQVDNYGNGTWGGFQLVLVEEPALTWYADPDGDGMGTADPELVLLQQGFDDAAAAMANGWAVQNSSDPVGTSSWLQGVPAVFSAQAGAPNAYIGADFNSGSGLATLSNWLFTPEVTLYNGAQLRFFTRTGAVPEYPDRLQVRMSTNGASTDVGGDATTVGDFTELLLDINPTYALAGYPADWTLYTVTVAGLGAPVTGRFAFRHFVENGGPGGTNSFYIGIDEVVYAMPGAITACEQPDAYVDNVLDDCPVMPGLVGDGCDDGDIGTTNDVLDETCTCAGVPYVYLNVTAMLEGPYDPATGLMDDALRLLPDFPTTEPYTALGYVHTGGGGGEVMGVSPVNGAFVDWVVVELRDPVDPGVVVVSRSCLLLRNGTINDPTTNLASMRFLIPPGDYHVAVRHRNHLGAMTASPKTLSINSAVAAFSSSNLETYGTDARKVATGVFGHMLLWAGDVSFDGEVMYTGSGNDRDRILFEIGGSVPTNTSSGYKVEDVNLDGTVKYAGENNDRDRILQNIGGVVPTNTRMEQMP